MWASHSKQTIFSSKFKKDSEFFFSFLNHSFGSLAIGIKFNIDQPSIRLISIDSPKLNSTSSLSTQVSSFHLIWNCICKLLTIARQPFEKCFIPSIVRDCCGQIEWKLCVKIHSNGRKTLCVHRQLHCGPFAVDILKMVGLVKEMKMCISIICYVCARVRVRFYESQISECQITSTHSLSLLFLLFSSNKL